MKQVTIITKNNLTIIEVAKRETCFKCGKFISTPTKYCSLCQEFIDTKSKIKTYLRNIYGAHDYQIPDYIVNLKTVINKINKLHEEKFNTTIIR